MARKDTTPKVDEDLDARPGDRIWAQLPDQAFAKLVTRLRRKSRLADSEIIRQALIRLDDEVEASGGLLIKVVTRA